MFSRRSSKRLRHWPRPSNQKHKTAGFYARRFSGNAMKFKIPEIKIPKVNIPKLRRDEEDSEPIADEEYPVPDDEAAEDVLNELEETEAREDEPAPAPQEKPKGYGMVISEDQLRMVWAGEIGFSLLIVFASVLIAIAS